MKLFFSITLCCSVLIAEAQLPVRDEPRHHNIFENDYIRILDVFLPPGDTTLYHLHNTPSVFTTFTRTATGSQLLTQPPSSDTSEAGAIWYDELQTARIHRVWNTDNNWFHVMDIELISKNTKSNPSLLELGSLNLLFSKSLVNGYLLQLSPKEKFQLPQIQTGYLLLSTGNAEIEYMINNSKGHRIMKAGHYLWISTRENLEVQNNGDLTATFLLLQLK